MKGYVGTYASACENGIYQFTFDEASKTFTSSELYQPDQDAKYLSLYDGILAYPFGSAGAGVKMIQNGMAYTEGNERHVSCYIIQDAGYIYTANYHDGTVCRYQKQASGLTACGAILIQEGAGAHQVILQKDVLFVPCRLLDCVKVYNRVTMEYITSIAFPTGSGPRHGVLNNEESILYLVSESTCELFSVNLKDSYRIEKIMPLLEANEHGGAAAIRKSADDRFLYISVRECNEIFVIEIEPWQIIQRVSSGGDHPRDIALDPSQRYLFAANRFSNNLVSFVREEQNGRLRKTAQLDDVVEGVSIVFEGGNK